MDDVTRTEVEAAAFRRLLDHLEKHQEVQNIDLMILANFCRNCLADWYREAAAERGVTLDKTEARTIVHRMPYDQWKAQQPPASPEQLAAFRARQDARRADKA